MRDQLDLYDRDVEDELLRAEGVMRKLAVYLKAFGPTVVDIELFKRVEQRKDALSVEKNSIDRILVLAE